MAYCINQTNSKNENMIVKIIKSKDDFLSSIQNFNQQKNLITLVDMSIEQIKNDSLIGDGCYLLSNLDQIVSIEKVKLVGYVYNSNTIRINYTWNLIPIDQPHTEADFQIEKFDPSIMTHNPRCLIIGDAIIDKNLIIQTVIDHELTLDPFRPICIITDQNQTNQFYTSKFPTAKIYYDYDHSYIQNELNNAGIIVLDICLKSEYESDNTLRELLYGNKYFGITIIVSITDPYDMGAEFRLIFSYMFLLKNNSQINQKKIYNSYAKMFPNLSIFRKVFDKVTADSIMCIVNTHTHTSWNKYVSYL